LTITPSQSARLDFLVRVTDKECRHLLDTDGRLFGELFTLEDAFSAKSIGFVRV
jgi:hypothetical protein